MPADTIPSVVVGAVLQILAIGLAYREWSAWKAGPFHLPEDDEARYHAQRQLRRRLRVSLLLGLVGVMIPLGDLLPVFYESPSLWVIHWLSVLAVVVLIILMALGDLASTVAFNKHAQTQLKRDRDALEAEIQQYRRQSNGQHRSELE